MATKRQLRHRRDLSFAKSPVLLGMSQPTSQPKLHEQKKMGLALPLRMASSTQEGTLKPGHWR